MVYRQSQEVKFQGGRGVQVQDAAGGLANPDYNKYRTSKSREGHDVGEGTADRLLDSITGTANKLLQQSASISQEEAYLRGAAAAGSAQSEDELEGNVFTKDWAKAGFRDTLGRVALAENEASLIEDMPKMRELGPEKYNEYLAEKRAALMPTLEGMSRKQRAGTMQNMLLSDRAAIKKHTAEHMKYQLEVENRSVQAAVGVQARALNQAKVSGPAYITATEAMYSTLHSSVVNNDKLPIPAKVKMLTEFMEFALSDGQDHQRLFETLQNEEIQLPDGRTGTMASMLPWDEAKKVGDAYAKSRERTKDMRSMQYGEAKAFKQADWDNPDTPLESYNSVVQFADNALVEKFMTGNERTSFLNDYYRAAAKKRTGAELGAAWSSGNQGKISSLGKTDEEAAEAWVQNFGRHMSPAERTAALVRIGLSEGRPQALNLLGKELAPAVAQLRFADPATMDPANAASLATVITTLDSAERADKQGVYSQVMQSFPQEDQAFIMDFREGLRAGLQPAPALQQSKAKMAAYAKMDPSLRKEMGAGNAKEDLEMLTAMTPIGMLSGIGLSVKSLVSSDAANRKATGTKAAWFENEERVQEVAASMKFAAADELRMLNITHPFMSKEARQSTVMATLKGRTVDTASGPLLLPRGTSLQSFFGVPASINQQRVGAAVDELYKPADGNRLVYSVFEGQLTFKELNGDAQIVNSGILDPKQIAPMVGKQLQREADVQKVVGGEGRTYKGITYTGENTSGLDYVQVFNMRQEFLTNGVVPVTTKTGTIPTDKNIKDPVDLWFRTETDKAAKAARLPMRTTGKDSQAALNLYAEAAFRTDGKFTSNKEYRPWLQAMAGQDEAAALSEMKNTPMYKGANAEEQKRFLDSVSKIFKGK
jgi:hypothetical protein